MVLWSRTLDNYFYDFKTEQKENIFQFSHTTDLVHLYHIIYRDSIPPSILVIWAQNF